MSVKFSFKFVVPGAPQEIYTELGISVVLRKHAVAYKTLGQMLSLSTPCTFGTNRFHALFQQTNCTFLAPHAVSQ